MVLREFAFTMPTFRFQQISSFFRRIFSAIFDPKSAICECKGQALRAALVVIIQRESPKSQNTKVWYRQCYDDAIAAIGEVPTKDKGVKRDVKEILRCSNVVWERHHRALKILQPEEWVKESPSTMFLCLKVQFAGKKGLSKLIQALSKLESYAKFSRQSSIP